MESEKDLVDGEIFNVGSNDQNMQILPLAKLIAEAINLPFNFEWYGSPDTRSYKVDFSKIKEKLGYKTSYTPREGAKEVYDALVSGKITDSIKTRTVEWYKYLLEAQKILKEVEINGVIL
jgi:nucleoside-diphosphate-sugar epimerase